MQEMKKLETRELSQLLKKELKVKKGKQASLMTLYLKPSTKLSVWQSRLKKEVSECGNIKSSDTRNTVLHSLKQIQSALKSIQSPPPNGLCVFSSDSLYIFEPPLPVKSDHYSSGKKKNN